MNGISKKPNLQNHLLSFFQNSETSQKMEYHILIKTLIISVLFNVNQTQQHSFSLLLVDFLAFVLDYDAYAAFSGLKDQFESSVRMYF